MTWIMRAAVADLAGEGGMATGLFMACMNVSKILKSESDITMNRTRSTIIVV